MSIQNIKQKDKILKEIAGMVSDFSCTKVVARTKISSVLKKTGENLKIFCVHYPYTQS